MTGDTFDKFTTPDRGLFGDNEQADTRAKPRRDDLIEIQLYRHRESPNAVLLSPNGAPSHTQWVPKSLIEEPATTELVHPAGSPPCEYGLFKIARFKARGLGWDAMADGKTLRLL